MKKSKIIIPVAIVLLSFAVSFFISACFLYTPCFSYNDDSEALNSYFADITKEPALTNATEKYHYYYDEIKFSYGDVVCELSEYDYAPVPFDDALNILKTDSLDDTAYQVNMILYSYEVENLRLSNIVYFEYDGSIYALAFYYDDAAFAGEYRTLFKTDMRQFPSEISDSVFENHDLIENLFKDVRTAVSVRAVKIASATAVTAMVIIGIIIAVRKKKADKKKSVGNGC